MSQNSAQGDPQSFYDSAEPVSANQEESLVAQSQYYLYTSGHTSDPEYFDVQLGIGVRISIQNVDALPTSILVWTNYGSEGAFIAPFQTSMFQFIGPLETEPIQWYIHFIPEAESLQINYRIESTWVPSDSE